MYDMKTGLKTTEHGFRPCKYCYTYLMVVQRKWSAMATNSYTSSYERSAIKRSRIQVVKVFGASKSDSTLLKHMQHPVTWPWGSHDLSRDSLGGQFVQISLAFVAPDNHTVNSDKVPSRPSLTSATGLRTKQGKVTCVINLEEHATVKCYEVINERLILDPNSHQDSMEFHGVLSITQHKRFKIHVYETSDQSGLRCLLTRENHSQSRFLNW